MKNNTKQVNIQIENTNIDYVSFGHGKKYLVIIPGVGDGLKNVKGLATYYAHKYQEFSKDYKVYVISRRNNLKRGFSINDMASDIYLLLSELNIKAFSIIGISQGGMIAQTLAINYPEIVEKLILIVTAPKPNSIMKSTINNWLKMLKHHEYKALLRDTAIKSFVGKSANKYLKLYELSYKVINKKHYLNYEILLRACLKFDSSKDLKNIEAKTLIIGAKLDQVLGYEGSELLNKNIKNSKLVLYDEYSHGLYDQIKGFNELIKSFLTNSKKEDETDD